MAKERLTDRDPRSLDDRALVAEILKARGRHDWHESRRLFGQLVERYEAIILKTFLNSDFREEEIEDLRQNTLLAAYRGLAKWRGQGELARWIRRIAERRALDRLRGRKRERRVKLEVEFGEPAEGQDGLLEGTPNGKTPAPLWVAQNREMIEIIRQHLGTEMFEMARLHYGENEPWETVGSAFGLTARRASYAIREAFVRLKWKLG